MGTNKFEDMQLEYSRVLSDCAKTILSASIILQISAPTVQKHLKDLTQLGLVSRIMGDAGYLYSWTSATPSFAKVTIKRDPLVAALFGNA